MDGRAERNRPTTSSHAAISLAPLPDSVAARVRETGAPGVNLYRALAHAPRLLEAWIDFAWALREHCDTPRRLRELVILRTAQCTLSQYECNQHRLMAAEAGVDEHQVAELPMWCTSPAFDEAERAADVEHRRASSAGVEGSLLERGKPGALYAGRIGYCTIPLVLE